jgi:diguanylate cyclase (GGDEF)-like protein
MGVVRPRLLPFPYLSVAAAGWLPATRRMAAEMAGRVFGRVARRILPQSLRGQFALALSFLSLLVLSAGIAAVTALGASSRDTEALSRDRLVHMQAAQDLVQRAVLIERQTEKLLSTGSVAALRESYQDIGAQMTTLERVVTGLADASNDVSVLDLFQASQLFQNTANVVTQLRETVLMTERMLQRLVQERVNTIHVMPQRVTPAQGLLLFRLLDAATTAEVGGLREEWTRLMFVAPLPDVLLPADIAPAETAGRDPFALQERLIGDRAVLLRLHDVLVEQARAIVAAARQQSAFYDADYAAAVRQLVEASRGQQRWVMLLLIASLMVAWLVGRVFMGRHVLRRLLMVSHHLQRSGPVAEPLETLVRGGGDEISDMARAVDRFMADRAQLEQRTSELRITKTNAVGQAALLEMIATGAKLSSILERLILQIEAQLEGITGSVLLLDESGRHLGHGVGPNLPEAYMQAIDGVTIGPDVGSCGSAAHHHETVIVRDIQTDQRWLGYRELAAEHGLRSCWSAPILSQQRAVLGTFAMYSSEPRVPTIGDLKLIELGTRIAGIAIERRQAEERIRHMAHHDELTGLPNRTLLKDRLATGLRQVMRNGRSVAVIFVDLDGFKFINDSFGHPVGDALLIAVAARLGAVVRKGDTVARLGGDEFVLLLHDLPRADDAVRVAEHIVATMSQPFQIRGRSMHVGASIGVSVSPGDGSNVDELLEHADVAMYRAKQQGRTAYQFYTGEMGSQARQRIELQTALSLALQERQFELHYQPQVDLRSGRIDAMEVLIRWRHPEMGIVSPAHFIPLAEETGLIVPIGEWVMRTACAQLKEWHDAGHHGLSVAVNVSARQFQRHDVVELVRDVLATCSLAPHHLELELTESALVLDTEAVLHTLLALKAMGVVLALDDFGTGYSNLSNLKRFPIDVIKIDQSFTADVTSNEQAASITRAIIAMARSLGARTIAEGVETEEQLRFMGEHRCDSIQGYFFSRPLPVAAMTQLLQEDRRLVVPAPDEAGQAVLF